MTEELYKTFTGVKIGITDRKGVEIKEGDTILCGDITKYHICYSTEFTGFIGKRINSKGINIEVPLFQLKLMYNKITVLK